MPVFATLCFLSYNRPQFLEEAIVSAVDLAGFPIEVIVHDDGSIDSKCKEVIDALRDGGYISTMIANCPGHNEGQGVALNRMFGIAKGDYIVKLDQDLVFYPDWLAKAVDIMKKDKKIGLLGLFRYHYDPVDYRKTRISGVETVDNSYSFHTHICGSGFVVPRYVYQQLGPFNERSPSFSEDWEFQRAVHASEYFNALPAEDLVHNRGFGIGTSTIVNEGNRITNIKSGPYIIR